MKDCVKMKKKTPKLLKIGNSCVIILLKESTEKLQKIRQVIMDESALDKKGVDKPTGAKGEIKMANITEKSQQNNLYLFTNLDGKTSDDLVTKFELDKMIPVKLDKVFDYCSIEVLPTDFKTYEEIPEISEIVDKKGLILGAVAIKNKQINILYKKDDTPHRQKFTVAHELAHCCLNAEKIAVDGHVAFRLDVDIKNAAEDEYEANVFAGELLIPKKTLDSLYKVIKKPKLEILSKIFDVSENVMRARLKYLKLPFEDSVNV